MQRRSFLKLGIAAGTGSLIDPSRAFYRRMDIKIKADAAKPVVIASDNRIKSVRKAYDMISAGADALDAVIAGVNIVEEDPNDHSVGLGGLPNEDGIVELDASCMHGPTHDAGAVAALRNIRFPSKVARLVMERTNHVLLVGEGALQFAKRHGFKEENLLTDAAQKIWRRWKENMSDIDNWLPDSAPKNKSHPDLYKQKLYGTVTCNALDSNGGLSGVTTTSGLAYKLSGRVGDSPIIGAGLYVDNQVGACGSTGLGEENLKNLSCFMVVEYMRMGKSVQEACLLMCRRIVEKAKTNAKPYNVVDKPDFDVKFYAINKQGEYGAAGIKGPFKFSVCDERGNRNEEGIYLYKS
jgi:N4-(beta-N-acetylglucosaminyl)-L-asparaginase